MVADAGLRYMITDAHGLLYAKPRPRYGMYAPIFTETGVAVFGRDHESSQQVWSAEVGYPGDPVYREFYKDLGYEADYEYIKPYIMPNGQRKNTGIKYHRITGRNLDLGQRNSTIPTGRERKQPNMPATSCSTASGKSSTCPASWGVRRWWWLLTMPSSSVTGGMRTLVLDFLIRKSYFDQNTYRMTHLAEYLRENPTHQVCKPAQSSWGRAASTSTGSTPPMPGSIPTSTRLPSA